MDGRGFYFIYGTQIGLCQKIDNIKLVMDYSPSN
jgi:hypothetical protein